MAELPTIHPNDEATAREILLTAEALGFSDHTDDLMESARLAIAWIAAQLAREDELAASDRCPECGTVAPCDCRIYPAAYGRSIYPIRRF